MLTPTFIIKSEIFFQQDSLNPTEKSRETGSILTSVKTQRKLWWEVMQQYYQTLYLSSISTSCLIKQAIFMRGKNKIK